MKTAVLTLLACIVSLNISVAEDAITPEQAEIIYLKHVNAQLEKRALELQATQPKPANADLQSQITAQNKTITSQNYDIIMLRKEMDELKSSETHVMLERYVAAVDAWKKSFEKLEAKYTTLVERWNAQQQAIAQQNTSPQVPSYPILHGKTDVQKAQESLEGIKFQLQQIQVENMGREDRAKYGY